MLPKIELNKKQAESLCTVILIENIEQLEGTAENHLTSVVDISTLNLKLKKASDKAIYQQPDRLTAFVVLAAQNEAPELEKSRRSANSLIPLLKDVQADEVYIQSFASAPHTLAFIEGLLLGLYEFNKYKTQAEPSKPIKKIYLKHDHIHKNDLKDLLNVTRAVYKARDLVNEPVIFLTAKQLSAEFEKLAEECKIDVEVLGKSKIKALKMGGLLAVNAGAPNPPTFTIMEYKPANALNKHPIVLVGKGVVFDTGGLSLKPTPGSMDAMKCDMAGAAAVGCALYAAALNKLPLYLVCLVPATENRPDGNATTPGDIITMMSGTTVEVLNTDAEGRLILADALHYAKRYKPQLVIDMATLTGAAARAIGKEGIVYMGTANQQVRQDFEYAGLLTHERLVAFPLWEEYESQIKSHVADLKNIGGQDAGAITAGAFLKAFTDYEWLHFDIAGPAFLDAHDHYRPKGGTGVGVRLLYAYLKNLALELERNTSQS